MRNKPGPRKKPGERYPSGDLKPVIAPGFWGRARDGADPQLSSELARLCFNRELTETQAAAGFRIADIFRSGDSAGNSPDDRRDITAASEPLNLRAAPARIALDRLLSEYPPKVREAVIGLCVFNRTVELETPLGDPPVTRSRCSRFRDYGRKAIKGSLRPTPSPLGRSWQNSLDRI